ncbi:polyprenyl synthetase family protein [Streptomyces sp. NPDC057623]|uniref:polyprenyl synthetase family protein n=1 Tax=Streptomyces sp. NPDC057623 TaxID=3346187 RepID=UPI0036B1C052
MDAKQITDYYASTVVPLRSRILEEHRALAAELNDPAGSRMTALIEELPVHRLPERPILTYLGWLLAGGAADAQAPAYAAVACEFSHEGGLIHDDIVDASPRRRQQPTVWAAYAAQHPEEPWADSFGRSVALWQGALMLRWAEDAFARALRAVPDAAAAAAQHVWRRSAADLWGSQHIDLVESARAGSSGPPGSAEAVVALKGRYVALLPLQIGCALAGGGPELMSALSAYAEPLGKAYILRNDLEGVFGTARSKPPNDLRERRLSVMIVLARRTAAPEQRRALDAAGRADLSEAEVSEIRDVLEKTGAREGVERDVRALAEEARSAAASPAFPEAARSLLARNIDTALNFHDMASPNASVSASKQR